MNGSLTGFCSRTSGKYQFGAEEKETSATCRTVGHYFLVIFCVIQLHTRLEPADTTNLSLSEQQQKREAPCRERRSCIYPGHGEVGHQLLKGPRLLSLLLVVQRDLLAELPGVGATCARGAGHGAGRWVETLEKCRTVPGMRWAACLSSTTSLQTH